MHGDAAEDVFGADLGVLHLDVEKTAVIEDTGIDELVLEFMPGPGPVHRHHLVVGELGLRVLVEVALIAVRRQVIDVEVVLLDVLTVVAFGIGQAEQALLQDRVPLVPQRKSQAQPLLVVADPGDAILSPAVRARPRLIMAEIRPRVLAVAVVLPDRPPLALAEIRSPGPPRNAGPGLKQPPFLGRQRGRIGQRRRARRIRHVSVSLRRSLQLRVGSPGPWPAAGFLSLLHERSATLRTGRVHEALHRAHHAGRFLGAPPWQACDLRGRGFILIVYRVLPATQGGLFT